MKRIRTTVVLAAASVIVLGGVVVTEQAVAGTLSVGRSDPSAAAVKQAAQVGTDAAAAPVFQPSPAQSVYVPIAPCRVVSTVAANHPIPDGAVRGFQVRGTGSLASQGGSAFGCGIPAAATAVTAQITTLHHPDKGTLKAWAGGAAAPAALVASFAAGAQSTSSATIGLSSPGQVPEIQVKSHGSATDVTLDVTGYYETQAHLIILADGTVWYGTDHHLTNLTHTANSGTYQLTFDRSLDGCNVLTSSNDARDVQAVGAWGGTNLTVSTSHESSGVFTSQDESFQLYVIC